MKSKKSERKLKDIKPKKSPRGGVFNSLSEEKRRQVANNLTKLP